MKRFTLDHKKARLHIHHTERTAAIIAAVRAEYPNARLLPGEEVAVTTKWCHSENCWWDEWALWEGTILVTVPVEHRDAD